MRPRHCTVGFHCSYHRKYHCHWCWQKIKVYEYSFILLNVSILSYEHIIHWQRTLYLYNLIPRVQCLCDGGAGITLIAVFTPAGRCGGSVRSEEGGLRSPSRVTSTSKQCAESNINWTPLEPSTSPSLALALRARNWATEGILRLKSSPTMLFVIKTWPPISHITHV